MGIYLALGFAIFLGVLAAIALVLKLWKWKSQKKSVSNAANDD